jgi:hypothetical protein
MKVTLECKKFYTGPCGCTRPSVKNYIVEIEQDGKPLPPIHGCVQCMRESLGELFNAVFTRKNSDPMEEIERSDLFE